MVLRLHVLAHDRLTVLAQIRVVCHISLLRSKSGSRLELWPIQPLRGERAGSLEGGHAASARLGQDAAHCVLYSQAQLPGALRWVGVELSVHVDETAGVGDEVGREQDPALVERRRE